MNLKLIHLLLAITLVTTANSQKQTLLANKASTTGVNIINTNPDEGKRASVYAGVFGPEGVNVAGASYYKPKTFYLNVMAGPASGMIDGSFFLISKMKETALKQSVKSGTVARHVISAPLEKRRSIGIHAGASYVDYSLIKINTTNNFSTNGVFAGVSFLSAGHAHWKSDSDSKEMQGTTIGRFNADIIYYTNRKITAAIDGKEQTEINDVSRKLGFRVYFDGKTSMWSGKGRTAIHYVIGIGRNSDKTKSFAPFAGLGFGYNFL